MPLITIHMIRYDPVADKLVTYLNIEGLKQIGQITSNKLLLLIQSLIFLYFTLFLKIEVYLIYSIVLVLEVDIVIQDFYRVFNLKRKFKLNYVTWKLQTKKYKK